MKKPILILTFISLFNILAIGQSNNTFFGSFEYQYGNYIGLDINVNYIYQEKYAVIIGASGLFRKSQSEPEDFKRGVLGGIFGALIDPNDTMDNFQLKLGKIIQLNNAKSIRLNLSQGIAYSIIKEPESWEMNFSQIGINYDWEYGKRRMLSMILNPKIEFVKPYLGFSISPLLIYNKDRSYMGLGIGMLFGRIK